jgi:chromosome partitioning protein
LAVDEGHVTDGQILPGGADETRPYVIVLGNEKGGTGKSTTAMHLIVALAKLDFTVGSIDLDARQGSLSRYIANRRDQAEESGQSLVMPAHRCVARAILETRNEAEAQERASLRQACAELASCNFIVIDTPGSDSYISRLAHENADTLITPINDSFLDVDVLAQIDRRRREVLAPSTYSQMVWEHNNRRVLAGRPPIDWVVMRNRLSHIEARNKREIAGLLTQLARRIGFRLAPGFGERVVFRELFLKGLTLLDLPGPEAPGLPPNPSHLAGRAEIRALVQTIGLTEAAPAAVNAHAGAQQPAAVLDT